MSGLPRLDTGLRRWGYEAARAGRAGWVVPVALAAGGGAFLGLLAAVHGPVGRTGGSLMEAVLPLGAAICAAGLFGGDSCVELHLSLPVSYGLTLARRSALVVGAAALVAVSLSAGLALSGTWSAPTGDFAGQLAWLVPLLVLCSLAAAVAALAANGRVAVGLVAALWTGEEWFKNNMITTSWNRALYLFATARADQPPFLVDGRLTGEWLFNRLVLLTLAPVLAATAWIALRHAHRLLGQRSGA
ncbi:MAG: hypothetical protein ACRDOI_11240 [Trebonia sp.]